MNRFISYVIVFVLGFIACAVTFETSVAGLGAAAW